MPTRVFHPILLVDMDLETEHVVVELRPVGTQFIWNEWLADHLNWDLVDAQVIKPDRPANFDSENPKDVANLQPFAKLVYRGGINSVTRLWKKGDKGMAMVYQGSMMHVKAVGLGSFGPGPTQFGPLEAGLGQDKEAATVPSGFQFDTHEDNNALHNNREAEKERKDSNTFDNDVNRKLDGSEDNIVDVIDELGDLLPEAQKFFEHFSVTALLEPENNPNLTAKERAHKKKEQSLRGLTAPVPPANGELVASDGVTGEPSTISVYVIIRGLMCPWVHV